MSVMVSDPQTTLAVPFVDATVSVFKTMLGSDCSPGGIFSVQNGEHCGSLTALIGLSGHVVGSISFSVSEEVSFKILERMTGIETSEVDDFVRDAVGEMANMIGGYGKRTLENFELKLGLPQVVIGKEYRIYAPRWAYHVWSPFESDIGPCAIEIGFDTQRSGR
jgi:chemotaxis protein CheX